MIPHQTKAKKLPGTSYLEVRKNAMMIFKQLERRTKRKPYIRSVYFRKQKVFFDFFWTHLLQKSPVERFTRLKYFAAALESVQESRNHPVSADNPHKPGELLHRFAGITLEGDLFYVQIKEIKRTGNRYFMSCFPAN